MMLPDTLQPIIDSHRKTTAQSLLLVLLKEALQDFILNYIYTSDRYTHLIFTGGTALRKLHGLPRHSEDLDFDYQEPFSIEQCAQDIALYFKKQLFYPAVTVKIARNTQTFFLKFPPLLHELGLAPATGIPDVLFVRLDVSAVKSTDFTLDTTPVTTAQSSFFTRSYDISTLFANKISAFLERTFFKGGAQSIPFKGRDVFDLMWLGQEAARKRYTMQPRWSKIEKELGYTKQHAIQKIREKVNQIDPEDIKRDLTSFIDEQRNIDTFSLHFKEIITRQLTEMERYDLHEVK